MERPCWIILDPSDIELLAPPTHGLDVSPMIRQDFMQEAVSQLLPKVVAHPDEGLGLAQDPYLLDLVSGLYERHGLTQKREQLRFLEGAYLVYDLLQADKSTDIQLITPEIAEPSVTLTRTSSRHRYEFLDEIQNLLLEENPQLLLALSDYQDAEITEFAETDDYDMECFMLGAFETYRLLEQYVVVERSKQYYLGPFSHN